MYNWQAFLCYSAVSRHISGCVYPLKLALADRAEESKNEWQDKDNDNMRCIGEQYKSTSNCRNYLSTGIHVYYRYN